MTGTLLAVVFTAVAFFAARAVLPRALALIEDAGFVQRNYRGDLVPSSAGAVVVLVYISALLGWHVLAPDPLLTSLAFLVAAMALLGLVDDVWGDKQTQGLVGHLRLLLRGGLSTGGVKAVCGLVVSFAAARSTADGWYGIAIGALVIALSANAVNLLDLRPGRALKGTVVATGLLFVVSAATPVWMYVVPLMAALAAYAPYDVRAHAMMGDAGANPIGAVVGMAAAVALSPPLLTLVAAALVLLHVVAERTSLSQIIEQVPALKYLDDLGRD